MAVRTPSSGIEAAVEGREKIVRARGSVVWNSIREFALVILSTIMRSFFATKIQAKEGRTSKC